MINFVNMHLLVVVCFTLSFISQQSHAQSSSSDEWETHVVPIEAQYTWTLIYDLEGPFEKVTEDKVEITEDASATIRHIEQKLSEHNVDLSISMKGGINFFIAKMETEMSAAYKYHTSFTSTADRFSSSSVRKTTSKMVKNTFNVPEGKRRQMYQLHLNMPGMNGALDVFSDTPRDALVQLRAIIKIRKKQPDGDSCSFYQKTALAIGTITHAEYEEFVAQKIAPVPFFKNWHAFAQVDCKDLEGK